MQDKKSSKKFQYDGSDIVMLWLLILSIRKTIKTDKKEFSHTIFVELFMAHLLEKSSRFYHRSEPRYMLKIKNVATLWKTRGKKNITFFLVQFLQFKLRSISDVNISKDAARCGLSRYILIIDKTSNYIS
jgi:hypothetical protein